MSLTDKGAVEPQADDFSISNMAKSLMPLGSLIVCASLIAGGLLAAGVMAILMLSLLITSALIRIGFRLRRKLKQRKAAKNSTDALQ